MLKDKENKERGKFFVLEGIDRCGKGTQLQKIWPWLYAHTGGLINCGSEPTDDFNPIGKKIRAILEHREPAPEPFEFQRFYVLDRAQDLFCRIAPALARGHVVLRERYALSTIAYGMLNEPMQKLLDLHYEVIGKQMIWPDLTILLDIPPETAMERLAVSGSVPQFFEKTEKLRKMRENYLQLAQQTHAAGQLLGEIKIINGEQPKEKVSADIQEAIRESLPGLQHH